MTTAEHCCYTFRCHKIDNKRRKEYDEIKFNNIETSILFIVMLTDQDILFVLTVYIHPGDRWCCSYWRRKKLM